MYIFWGHVVRFCRRGQIRSAYVSNNFATNVNLFAPPNATCLWHKFPLLLCRLVGRGCFCCTTALAILLRLFFGNVVGIDGIAENYQTIKDVLGDKVYHHGNGKYKVLVPTKVYQCYTTKDRHGRKHCVVAKHFEHGNGHVVCRLEGKLAVECEVPNYRKGQGNKVGPAIRLSDVLDDKLLQQCERYNLHNTCGNGKQHKLDCHAGTAYAYRHTVFAQRVHFHRLAAGRTRRHIAVVDADDGRVKRLKEFDLLALTAQKVMNRQGSMVVRNVNETIMEIFEVTGFVDVLTIE